MIPKKEFYFIRHGQTDYNLKFRAEHPPHAPLNATGRSQALAIEPIVAKLPVKAICYSPMKRAVETKEIVSARLSVPHFEVPDLGECTAHIWQEMPRLKEKALTEGKEPVLGFAQRVLRGFHTALSHEGPVLIVAHGGVHWALCSILNIQGHEWATDNCIPLHFTHEDGQWRAKKLLE